jgi:hypothetical protein
MTPNSTDQTQSANRSTINCALFRQERTQCHGDPSRTENHARTQSSELSVCHYISSCGEIFAPDSSVSSSSSSHCFRLRPAGWWFRYHCPPRAWWTAVCFHSAISTIDPSPQNDGHSTVNRITAVPLAQSSVGATYFVGILKGCSHHSLTRAFTGVESTESKITARYRDAGRVMILSQSGPWAHLASTGRRCTRKGEAYCSIGQSYANYRLESCWFSHGRFSFVTGQI